jgi:dinuclear metal center YbgI/SA1388 family protein
MPELSEVVDYCQTRLNVAAIRDFSGSHNGLQVANSGKVTRIAAVVDAGLTPFRLAADKGADFILCHHGMFWDSPVPVTGATYDKLKLLFRHDMALYSAHLPLDAHRELGNNAVLAAKLELEVERWGLAYEGVPMAPVCRYGRARESLHERLEGLFPRVTALAFGQPRPERVCIVTGSGNVTLHELAREGVDTLVTGELKQSCFNTVQELGLNVFLCGHYATEVFGVRALAAELSEKFRIPWDFIDTGCPL